MLKPPALSKKVQAAFIELKIKTKNKEMIALWRKRVMPKDATTFIPSSIPEAINTLKYTV